VSPRDVLDLLAILSPFILAALLVGSAIVGSRLKPAAKRKAELFVVLPLAMAAFLASIGLSITRGEWLALVVYVIGLAAALLIFFSFRRKGADGTSA
jgi:peptidoglycan/LPS O-acetylase OafA/YrhL